MLTISFLCVCLVLFFVVQRMIHDGKASVGGLCPAVVAENSIEETKAVVDKAKEGACLPTVTLATATSASVDKE
jgi:hypothetical protein